MSDLVISIRPARTGDAAALACVFDAAWREAYLGIIPGVALQRMLARRGPRWWQASIDHGRPLVVLDIHDRVAGYVAYGRCRNLGLPADGEIDEFYLSPEYQGLGFGTRMFRAVRNDFVDRGVCSCGAWPTTSAPAGSTSVWAAVRSRRRRNGSPECPSGRSRTCSGRRPRGLPPGEQRW